MNNYDRYYDYNYQFNFTQRHPKKTRWEKIWLIIPLLYIGSHLSIQNYVLRTNTNNNIYYSQVKDIQESGIGKIIQEQHLLSSD